MKMEHRDQNALAKTRATWKLRLPMQKVAQSRAMARNLQSHGDFHNAMTDKGVVRALEQALKNGEFKPGHYGPKGGKATLGKNLTIYKRGGSLAQPNVSIHQYDRESTKKPVDPNTRSVATFRKLDNGTWIDITRGEKKL